jgi:hypothetical protein
MAFLHGIITGTYGILLNAMGDLQSKTTLDKDTSKTRPLGICIHRKRS